MRWATSIYTTLSCIAAIFCISATAFSSLVPHYAHAHEVYVLDAATVDSILHTASPNPFSAIDGNALLFATWVMIGISVVTVVLLVSILRPVERKLDPLLFTLKRKSGFFIIRVTIGLAIMASGYFGALFGPELPLQDLFGDAAAIVQVVLFFAGACITLGLATHLMALAVLLITGVLAYRHGWYIFTYSNYLGDLFVIAFLGSQVWSLDKHLMGWHAVMNYLHRFVERYGFLILRVTFGVSLIYASVFAKFIHSELALRTVLDYNLIAYFHFDPLFIVLGAGLIEITLGAFIMIGFEVRFASLFLMFFLTLSLVYFGEAVWPHIVLFGGALALCLHGYDRYTIEGYFFKDAKHEPVL